MEWEPDALEVPGSFITDAITTVLEVDGQKGTLAMMGLINFAAPYTAVITGGIGIYATASEASTPLQSDAGEIWTWDSLMCPIVRHAQPSHSRSAPPQQLLQRC
jgi:hypothetical protein